MAKAKSPKLNVRLLRRIQRHILAEPKRLDMRSWLIMYSKQQATENSSIPRCGTVACIAGWAVALTRKVIKNDAYIQYMASKELGLGHEEDDNLFLPSTWPSPWRERLLRYQPGTKLYAEVVSRYIDFFIEESAERAKKEQRLAASAAKALKAAQKEDRDGHRS